MDKFRIEINLDWRIETNSDIKLSGWVFDDDKRKIELYELSGEREPKFI